MVTAISGNHHRLVKDKFGIDHMFAVIGASMGGMQTLHPDDGFGEG